MTRDPITDPEVLADLRFRADSEGDRDRARNTRASGIGSGPAPIVEHWPCRRCRVRMVGVPQLAIEAREVCNAKLARRGEAAIAKHEVMICDECKAEVADLERMEAEAKAAARRPHEQKPLELGDDQVERPSGQRTNRRRTR